MSEPVSKPLREIAGGGLWSLLLRLTIRGIGLLSVVILARLLTPSDFGLVAMASVVTALVGAVTELGANLFLVRTPSPTREYCDSVWTLRVVQGAVISVIVFAAAPAAAAYFDDARLEAVLRVVALVPLIGGLENIGVTLLLKERRFREEMSFRVLARVLSFFITISLALALREYWALVFAQVAAALVETLLSYRVHPYRPGLSTSKFREILPFSGAVFTRGIGFFIYSRSDLVIVGRIADTATVGLYSVASELAAMLTQEVANAVSRASYPVYSTLSADKPAFVAAFLQTMTMMASVILPAGIGLCLVSRDLVLVLLGEPWSPAAELLPWLAVFGIFATFAHACTGNVLLALGAQWWSAAAFWVFVVLRVLTVAGFGLAWGTSGIVRGLAIVSLFWVMVAVVIVKRVLPVTAAMLLGSIARPLLATGGMAVTVLVLGYWDPGVPAIRLATQIIGGAFTYICTVYVIWRLQGRPFGIEHIVLENVRKRLGKV